MDVLSKNCGVNPKKNPKLYEPDKLPGRSLGGDAVKIESHPIGEFFGFRINGAILGTDITAPADHRASLIFFGTFLDQAKKIRRRNIYTEEVPI